MASPSRAWTLVFSAIDIMRSASLISTLKYPTTAFLPSRALLAAHSSALGGLFRGSRSVHGLQRLFH